MAHTGETKRRRNSKVGYVISTTMPKTIVVEVTRQKAHAMYKRVISRSKKFYAHEKKAAAQVGVVARSEKPRPLSRLKRWPLPNVLQRPPIAPAASGDL